MSSEPERPAPIERPSASTRFSMDKEAMSRPNDLTSRPSQPRRSGSFRTPGSGKPKLVAVSKKKPPNRLQKIMASMAAFDPLVLFEPTPPPRLPRTVLVNEPLPPQAWAPSKKGLKQLQDAGIESPDTKKAGKKGKGKAKGGEDGAEKGQAVVEGGADVGQPKQDGLGNDDPTGIEVDRLVGKKASLGWEFSSNQVLTSKYNIITFIPKNLLEQFRRVANIFFLVLVILQFFPKFSNVSPALAALPLLVVLAITALKDAYEDLKRHQSDIHINNLPVSILHAPNFHNPNLTMAKGRTFGIPGIGGRFGISQLAFWRKKGKEAAALAEVEEVIVETKPHDEKHKKHFWGKRSFKPKKTATLPDDHADANGVANGNAEPAEVPRPAPGGGTVQGAERSKKDSVMRKRGTSVSKKNEPIDPSAHQEGDEYDEEDTAASVEQEEHGGRLSNVFGSSRVSSGDGRPRWRKQHWEDLKVGDFVKLRGDESTPADIVICATSEPENICYVETKNLDGETNLKSRSAVPELTHIRSAQACTLAKFKIQSEAPDTNMFRYSAAVELGDGRLGKDGKPLRCPVTLNTTLLRGCVVRNTDWVIGVVVFTGRDTKIVLNSGGTPSKRSKMERQMNPMVFLNLGILACLCVFCAIGTHFFESYYYKRNSYWTFGDDIGGDNPSINGLVGFANAMITFQNIVPISLYISIEFVRTAQAWFIWADDDIMLQPNGRRTTARSWNLSDDLGQIEYIFSDKTGTLTQNSMQFRQCSVGGKIYKGDSEEASASGSDLSSQASKGRSKESSEPIATTLGSTDTSNKKAKPNEAPPTFHDAMIEKDLEEADSAQARRLHGFFVNLALCHTVLASENEDGSLTYKAQSPDEAALVQAAADVGFVFLGRDKNILKLQTPSDTGVTEWELLNVLEFTSARKRMSVIVKKLDDDNERLFLLTKGADNVIFERLAEGQDSLKKQTDQHLEEFANEGLRTLCLAYRQLSEEEYDNWDREFHEATIAIEGRDDKIENISNKLERDLQLLGATAIEDKLQEGVPEALQDLKRAGIKVWVATGDKLETAIAIGMSSNLLTQDMNLIIIKGGEYGKPGSAYLQMRNALERFFDAGELISQLDHQPPDQPRQSLSARRSMSGRGRPSNQLERTVSGLSGLSDIVGGDNGQRPGGYGLVIDGSSLTHALGEPWSKDILLELSTRCNAVICCRTSPLQKALIVKLVREGLGAMCLAIGDGANDVSMIQAADVGVGVAGEEGLQAVNSSDYAIAQFRFLKRLLLVHGHWSYFRNSNMIMNFFAKEIIGIGILFFFQFYCGYSTTTVYEYTYLLFWNVFWTLLPVIGIGVFDRDIDDTVLMQVPELYHYGRSGMWFTLPRFCLYMFEGIYQSVICYFFILYAYDTTTPREDGYTISMYEFSTVMAISAVWATNLWSGFNTYAWTWWIVFAVLFGPVLILLYTAVYSAISPGWIWTVMYGYNDFFWNSFYFYWAGIYGVVISILPRLIYRFSKEIYFPNDLEILRLLTKDDPHHDFVHDPRMPHSIARTRTMIAGTDYGEPDTAVPLARTDTPARSITDMSTGLRLTNSRGYNFDQADGMGDIAVGRPLRQYTSSRLGDDSEERKRNRSRSGSIKFAGIELGFPSLRRNSRAGARQGRERGNTNNSLRKSLFRGRHSGHHADESASHAAPAEDPVLDHEAPNEGEEGSSPPGVHREDAS